MTGRSAHPRVHRQGGRQPTRVRKHWFEPDPDVPADQHERQYCDNCGLPGQPGDARHLSEDEVQAQRQYEQRRLGEPNE